MMDLAKLLRTDPNNQSQGETGRFYDGLEHWKTDYTVN